MKTSEEKILAIKWTDDGLHLLDQRLLPYEESYISIESSEQAVDAIVDMVVRGAPAIGITAAYAVVLSAQAHCNNSDWKEAVYCDIDSLLQARPTAVNLGWALARMKRKLAGLEENPVAELLSEARAIHDEDITANLHMGEAGAELLPQGSRVLTHCNAGALATGGYGTALGVIRSAWRNGKLEQVYADETRPWLQGSRLTAWELCREGIPTTVLCEGAAASLMQQGMVDWVIVGADRIAANGDIANKIGTYGLAVLAGQHDVKFMVVAPTSTVDMTIARGADIPIEYRDAEEILVVGDKQLGQAGCAAWNPVFDVTPADLIDFIVTETATVARPDKERMRAVFR